MKSITANPVVPFFRHSEKSVRQSDFAELALLPVDRTSREVLLVLVLNVIIDDGDMRRIFIAWFDNQAKVELLRRKWVFGFFFHIFAPKWPGSDIAAPAVVL